MFPLFKTTLWDHPERMSIFNLGQINDISSTKIPQNSQIIIFHQIRGFPFQNATFWGPRSCEVRLLILTRFPPPPQSCMPPRTVNCTPTLQSGKAPSLHENVELVAGLPIFVGSWWIDSKLKVSNITEIEPYHFSQRQTDAQISTRNVTTK